MNNEEMILALLEKMDKRLDKLETGQADLRAEMNDRFDSLELSIKEAWKDIGIVEDRIDLHDVAIKKIM